MDGSQALQIYCECHNTVHLYYHGSDWVLRTAYKELALHQSQKVSL